MMTHYSKFAVLLAVLGCAQAGSAFAGSDLPDGLPMAAPESVGMSSERLERLTRAMRGYVARGELAGTVTLVARHGKVVYFETEGDRWVEEHKPMTKDTIFRIASMTKPITTTALMMLYEEGAFDLDDPIAKWLPEFENPMVAIPAPNDERVTVPYKLVPAARPISVRHVLTHTAGLPNGYRNAMTQDLLAKARAAYGSRPETVEESIRSTAKVPLNFHPGESWEYGGGTSVAGVLVEKISGVTLDAFFRERIFEPLGMTDSYFNVPKEKVERSAALYRPDEAGKIELAGAPQYREPNRYFSGGGGLSSTAADYFRFHQMILNGGEYRGVRLLSPRTVNLMISNHIGDLDVWLRGPGYGFGLGYSVLLDPGTAKEHLSPGTFSWGGAFNTYFWVDPVEDVIAIFMSQIRPYTHLAVRTRLGALVSQAIIELNEAEPRIMGYAARH